MADLCLAANLTIIKFTLIPVEVGRWVCSENWRG
eukprot:CAMPEP_0172469106 /NCGR_PEP_ID=MMETSP1065-20121228/62930_1 /TAXON_ID=265537 /ORGANISM="Amphiprora paludosa, Strain CCMP125" /LENGTH=33 /DNA_ID= /DNA_START= /DNA_END= /DNA_ORIENTATION=